MKGNRELISPIFKFSSSVGKLLYTTNVIESLNSAYRKLNRQMSVFPSDKALLKALYMSTFEAMKKWTVTIRNWGQVYMELSIMYGRYDVRMIKIHVKKDVNFTSSLDMHKILQYN